MANTHTDAIVVFCTAPPSEAEKIADALVAGHLAACVNTVPVRSRYEWEGRTCVDEEHLLIIKTRQGHLGELTETIRNLHSYEVPEILALPVTGGYTGYLDWIRQVIP